MTTTPNTPSERESNPTSTDPASDDRGAAMRRTMEALLGVPATDGNRVTVLRNGDRIFAAMLDAIAAAGHSIDFLTFVYWQERSPSGSPPPSPVELVRASECVSCSTRSARDTSRRGTSR